MNSSFVVPAASYEALNAYRRLQMTMDRSDLRMAVLEIRTFLKMYPDLALACNDLGVLYSQSNEKLLALACFEKANRLQPNTPVIVQNLAEFYFVELGWTDDALLMLTELLKSYPDNIDLLNMLGTISLEIGREEEAASFFRRVLQLDPSNIDADAAMRRFEGNTTAVPYSQPVSVPACNTFQQPVAQPVVQQPVVQQAAAPAPSAGGSSLDDILARLRANISTPQPEQKTVVPAPAAGNADQRYREAQNAAAAGNEQQAIAILEQLVNDNPLNPLAHNDLGVLYTNAGKYDVACNHHELAVRQAPATPLFAKNLAALYYSFGNKTDEAVEIYTRLMRENPSDTEVLTALAIISNNNNLKGQARTFIQRVLDYEPWNSEARQFLSEL
ncbi:MAG: tetratricopeptide repeat protein [Trichlorobacter sp.]|nr:tetratricopeptide repeat protein [Trichlorobacter sp.]